MQSKIFTIWKTFETILPKTVYFGFVPFSEGMKLAKIICANSELAISNLLEFQEKQNLLSK